MLQGKVYGVYFSPTGGTRAYVTALAGLLSCEAEEIDLTAREERARDHVFGPEDLVILGAPVYAGRLPQLEGGIFERLRGDGTPAVFNVSYGNRAFEDALLEEQDICQAHGFHGIAAGAWDRPSHLLRPHRGRTAGWGGPGKGAGICRGGPGAAGAAGLEDLPAHGAGGPALPAGQAGGGAPRRGRELHPMHGVCVPVPGGSHPSGIPPEH